MKSPMKADRPRRSASGPVPAGLVNRGYNARMRDVYYLKADALLSQFRTRAQRSPLAPDLALFDRLSGALRTARDYATQASAGMAHSASGPPPGVPAYFKEEVLFIHLLEEIHNSCLFLRSRYATVRELAGYRDKISNLLKKGGRKGYLTKILDFLGEKQSADESDVREILRLVTSRMALCRRIFDIIRTGKGANAL